MTLSMTLDIEQALHATDEPLRLVDSATNTEYVVLRADVYERVRPFLAEGFDPREMRNQMAKVFGPSGWDDPGMDVYDELDPRRLP